MSKRTKTFNNITTLNATCSLLLQAANIISGLVIPRIIISVLGSETNGLISSLSQFLNCATLLEGGLSLTVMANLYSPLHKRDDKNISALVNASKKIYKQISYIFACYALSIAVIYPLTTNTEFSFSYISTLTLIIAFSTFIQYNLSMPLKLLFNADKKVYLTSIVQIITILLNTLTTSFILVAFKNIHLAKLIATFIFLLQPLCYHVFIKKYFNINKSEQADKRLFKSRWDGLGVNIAAFIHYNTDIVVLTLFTNLETVSIYSIYALVTTGLRQVVTSISAGIVPSLGHAYASKNQQKLKSIFEKYEFSIFFITYLLFGIGGMLITHFVMTYTQGVTDANYYQPIFGILMIIAEAICCLREPYINMAYSANRLKAITKNTLIEALINILLSIILVPKFGLIGVAIGTIAAMTYRLLFQLSYLKTIINSNNIKRFLQNVLCFTAPLVLGIIFCITFRIVPTEYTLWQFIKFGFLYFILFTLLFATFNTRRAKKIFKINQQKEV